MSLRDRRAQRREERQQFGPGGSATRFRMRQKLVSLGDDFWIEDDAGAHVFRVDGKALRLRNTLDLEDAHGTHLYRIQTRVMHLRDSMAIEDPNGDRVALVHKALIAPLRERWKVDLDNGGNLEVQGNIVDHEYEIDVDGKKVAEISKRWFRLRDTYGVQIAPGADVPLLLAVAVAVDAMSHPAR